MGVAANSSLITIVDKLGFYKILSQSGQVTSQKLAIKTQTSERYLREWLSAQAASGYVEYVIMMNNSSLYNNAIRRKKLADKEVERLLKKTKK